MKKDSAVGTGIYLFENVRSMVFKNCGRKTRVVMRISIFILFCFVCLVMGATVAVITDTDVDL